MQRNDYTLTTGPRTVDELEEIVADAARISRVGGVVVQIHHIDEPALRAYAKKYGRTLTAFPAHDDRPWAFVTTHAHLGEITLFADIHDLNELRAAA